MTTLDLERVRRHAIRLHDPELGAIHGPRHWQRVEQLGCLLAAQTGADLAVVCLFAWFHDAYRRDNGDDPAHGLRAAQAIVARHGDLFQLTAEALEKLRYACAHHADGQVHLDVTIGTCWDADRLDLGRVGIVPAAELLSTAAARGKALVTQPCALRTKPPSRVRSSPAAERHW
jgi:uncharacterized protein